MPQDKSIAAFIRTNFETKIAVEVDILKKAIDIVKSANREPSSEIIDLAFALTGYGKADIPGGEAQIAGHCFTTLIRYLTLRANPNNESLEESLVDLITQSVRLYGELTTNLGRVIPLTQPQTGRS